jgi:hypothetical protein
MRTSSKEAGSIQNEPDVPALAEEPLAWISGSIQNEPDVPTLAEEPLAWIW